MININFKIHLCYNEKKLLRKKKMFRQMRRNKQLLSNKESIEILNNQTAGVLSLLGYDNYPYSLPISYVYNNSKIFFHHAKEGHMIDAIKKHDKASFCIISENKIAPEKYTTHFKSVIAFGKIRILEKDEEIRNAITMLSKKYNKKAKTKDIEKLIDKEYNSLCTIELDIKHMTGKQAKELIK